MLPLCTQTLKHGERTAFFNLSESTKHIKFLIGHTHLNLVSLFSLLILPKRSQLSRRSCIYDLIKTWKPKLILRVNEKTLEINLIDASYRVDICRRTVVLCEVASESLIEIARAEDEEEALLVSHPRS